MNTMYYVAAVVIAVVLLAVLLRKKGKPAPETPAQEEKRECGDPALYELGMNPVSDKPIMYALTTCLHCKNTKKFLEENNIEVTVIHLDDYCDSQRSDLMEKVRTYNPRGTFPVVLMPNGKVIVGFRQILLKEALSDDARRTA
ncbi:MAG: glutaredoxin family protein [Mailhella sp.]|nr:glutaredoxin family protein [Mailhella sp.]